MAAASPVPRINLEAFPKYLENSIIRKGYSSEVAIKTVNERVYPMIAKIVNAVQTNVSLRLCFPIYGESYESYPESWQVLPCRFHLIYHKPAIAVRIEICYCRCWISALLSERLANLGLPSNLVSFDHICDCKDTPFHLAEQLSKEESSIPEVFIPAINAQSNPISVSSERAKPTPSTTQAMVVEPISKKAVSPSLETSIMQTNNQIPATVLEQVATSTETTESSLVGAAGVFSSQKHASKEQSSSPEVFAPSAINAQSNPIPVSSEPAKPTPSTVKPVFGQSVASSLELPVVQTNNWISHTTALEPASLKPLVARSETTESSLVGAAAVATSVSSHESDDKSSINASGAAAASTSSVDHQSLKSSYKKQQRERLKKIRSDNSKSSFDSFEASYSAASTATAAASTAAAAATTTTTTVEHSISTNNANSQQSQGHSSIKKPDPKIQTNRTCAII